MQGLITMKNSLNKLFLLPFFVVLLNMHIVNPMQEAHVDPVVVDVNKAAFDAFVKKFEVPEKLKQLIQTHEEKFLQRSGVDDEQELYHAIPEIPGWMAKGGELSRIYHADRMRECIEQFSLNSLYIPQKYVYIASNGNAWVVAEVISGEQRLLTEPEVFQLATLTVQVGLYDWGNDNSGDNIRFTKDGKVAIVDTEMSSFTYGVIRTDTPGGLIAYACPLSFAVNLKAAEDLMPDNVKVYLNDFLKQFATASWSRERAPFPQRLFKFADPEIDLQRVLGHMYYFREAKGLRGYPRLNCTKDDDACIQEETFNELLPFDKRISRDEDEGMAILGGIAIPNQDLHTLT